MFRSFMGIVLVALPLLARTSEYERAQKLIGNEQYEQAAQVLEKAPQNDVDNLELLGEAYVGLKDFKKAIQDFDEAIRLKPNYLNAVHNRALAKKNSGDTEGYNQDHELELQLNKKK